LLPDDPATKRDISSFPARFRTLSLASRPFSVDALFARRVSLEEFVDESVTRIALRDTGPKFSVESGALLQ
jgi:hypothetical protein